VGPLCSVNAEMAGRAIALGEHSGDSRLPATDRRTAAVVHCTSGEYVAVGVGCVESDRLRGGSDYDRPGHHFGFLYLWRSVVSFSPANRLISNSTIHFRRLVMCRRQTGAR
jgi:hypothetical protein